jgi:hypothetical protein
MHQAIGRLRIGRLGFYFAAIALVAIVWRVQHGMDVLSFPPRNTIISSFSSSENPNLSWQQIGFQAVSQMDSLGLVQPRLGRWREILFSSACSQVSKEYFAAD